MDASVQTQCLLKYIESSWGFQTNLLRDPSQRTNCPLSGARCCAGLRLLIIYGGSCKPHPMLTANRGSYQGFLWCSLLSSCCRQRAVTHRAHPPEKGTGSASWGLRKQVPVNLLATPRQALDLLPPEHTPCPWRGPTPAYLPNFTPVETCNIPGNVCVSARKVHFGDTTEGIHWHSFLEFCLVPPACGVHSWREDPSWVVAASLPKSSVCDHPEGHIYEAPFWKWKWD